MVGPGRRAGSHRWAGCRASSFRSPFEGAGQLCDVVLGTRRAVGEAEPQASLLQLGAVWPPGFRQGDIQDGCTSVSWVCLQRTGPARREEAEKLSCDTLSQGQCPPQGREERQLLY